MVISKNVKEEKKQTSINEQQYQATGASLKEKLIALICISFFPLLYLIGSSIVKYFG